MLTGWDNPAYTSHPLHDTYFFAVQMMRNMTTFSGINRYMSLPRGSRHNIRNALLNSYAALLSDYPAGDPNNLRKQLGPEDYLVLIDIEADEEDAK